MNTLEGKVALITGAGRRVGAVIVRHLHAEGANIAIHYRSSGAEAEKLREELLGERKDSVMLIKADLLEPGTPRAVVQAAHEAWGSLDVLVNNASLFYPTQVAEVTDAQWDELLGINLKAPFFLAQAAADHLKQARGTIVNIVDIYAERPLKAFSVYSIAKAGLAMMTKSFARELGPEVRVNAVAPGAILWPEEGTAESTQKKIIARTALKRQGVPADIARAILYLIRDADYVTGQIVTVDGGRTLTN